MTGRTAVRNVFRYGVYMWLVDLDELEELDRPLWAFGAERRALTTIRSRDHLGDPGRSIRENVDAYLALARHRPRGRRACSSSPTRACSATSSTRSRSSTATTATASCAASSPRCTTPRRAALLPARSGRAGRAETDKEFYVSPFLTVDGRYRMRSRRPGTGCAIQMSLEQDGERVFAASLTGTRAAVDQRLAREDAVRYPLMTAKVTTLIHLQGLRLHRRGVAHVRRPPHPPQDGVG